MFESFLTNGSLASVIMMEYGAMIMYEAHSRRQRPDAFVNLPGIAFGPTGQFLMILSLPAILWPAIYIGIYDGIIAGIVAWLSLKALSHLASFAFLDSGIPFGLQFIIAGILVPVGYLLSVLTLI